MKEELKKQIEIWKARKLRAEDRIAKYPPRSADSWYWEGVWRTLGEAIWDIEKLLTNPK